MVVGVVLLPTWACSVKPICTAAETRRIESIASARSAVPTLFPLESELLLFTELVVLFTSFTAAECRCVVSYKVVPHSRKNET